MTDLAVPARLDDRMSRIFGAPTDSIHDVERRARSEFPGIAVVVWEGDPTTFQFGYVSDDARVVLGHPAERWVAEPTFWVDTVVHPEDREDAVAYCALATGRGCHHTFEYRARHQDGSQVWLRDIVCVVLSPRGVPQKLRGIMFDVTAEKRREARPAAAQVPSLAELHAMA